MQQLQQQVQALVRHVSVNRPPADLAAALALHNEATALAQQNPGNPDSVTLIASLQARCLEMYSTAPVTQPSTSVTAAAEATRMMADHLQQQEIFRREPWRATLKTARAQYEAMEAATNQHVLDTFRDQAKNQMLCPDEVMAMTYLMYGNGCAAKVYAQMVMQYQGLERVRRHNWFVADHLDEQWMTANGDRIDGLQWPLFPPVPEFSALNTMILRNTEGVTGGAAGGTAMPRCFRAGPVGGAVHVPIDVDGHGNYAANVTEIAEAFNRLKREVADSKREIADLRRQLGANNNNRAKNRAGPDRASEDRGRNRGSRGRGGRSYRPHGGDTPQDDGAAAVRDKGEYPQSRDPQ